MMFDYLGNSIVDVDDYERERERMFMIFSLSFFLIFWVDYEYISNWLFKDGKGIFVDSFI